MTDFVVLFIIFIYPICAFNVETLIGAGTTYYDKSEHNVSFSSFWEKKTMRTTWKCTIHPLKYLDTTVTCSAGLYYFWRIWWKLLHCKYMKGKNTAFFNNLISYLHFLKIIIFLYILTLINIMYT